MRTECLLDGDYITRDDRPVIRLYLKGESGSKTQEVSDFHPYFYAVPKDGIDELSKSISGLEGVEKAEKITLIEGWDKKQFIRVQVRHPTQVADLREKVLMLQGCAGYLEADIPFFRRYVTDSGIVPMQGAEAANLIVAAIDCEISAKGEPDAQRDPIHMISYADSKGLERVWFWGSKHPGPEYAIKCEDERQMIDALIRTVSERDINILTGYNTDNFDFPYFDARCEKLGITLELGISKAKVKLERRGMNMGARVPGRPHIDMYPVCRQVFNLPRYQLEDVYEHLFNERKADIKVKQIRQFYESQDPKEFESLCIYSLSDAVSTLKIALKMLPLMYELSRVIRQPVYETSRMGSGQRVECLLMEQAHSRGIIVPNRPSDAEFTKRDNSKYEGAFVVDPVRGIHDNIILFDFRSLYPSIIISHNIDPASLDCACCRDTAHKAPNGHHFCEKRRGFIPEVLEKVIEKRLEIKKRLKNEQDAEKRQMLDVSQQAMKLLANSMYGYYGFQRARWYCRQCAEAIAGFGRVYIQRTIEAAKKAGFSVIYGDTDSVYLTLADLTDKKKIMEAAFSFQKKINESLPDAMDLEFEGFYPRGVFITKKRYALIGEDDKLTVKGLETRRRDWCDAAKNTQQKVLDALLKDRDPDKAAQIVKDMVNLIRAGDMPLNMLAINTQMTRSLGGYVSEGPHIAAVRKAMRRGLEFKRGDIVTYIVKKGNTHSIGERAFVIDHVSEGEYDPEYYINNQVLPAVMRILEALGFQEDEMKGLGRQTTLGGW